jgi:hypothetical protein
MWVPGSVEMFEGARGRLPDRCLVQIDSLLDVLDIYFSSGGISEFPYEEPKVHVKHDFGTNILLAFLTDRPLRRLAIAPGTRPLAVLGCLLVTGPSPSSEMRSVEGE